MQKVQLGGGFIAPSIAAHVRKSDAQAQPQCVKPAKTQEKAASQVGGGLVFATLAKHVGAHMGGGIISPKVAKHVGVQMGGGWIHPTLAKHIGG